MATWIVCVTTLLSASSPNLLVNPQFDRQSEGWGMEGAGAVITCEEIDGASVGRIVVPQESATGFPKLCQTYPVSPGQTFEASARVMAVETRDGHGAYIALEFFDEAGNRVGLVQTTAATNGAGWTSMRVRGLAPGEATKARICLLLNGHGEARFDEAALRLRPDIQVNPPALAEPMTLTVTDEVACESLLGMGFEDDGWFYNQENAKQGATEEDAVLREARIRWMNPSFVRMFFWHHDWCPSGDWVSFTFDSENMQSHYRTLALYQELGCRVDVTGTEWGMPKSYENPEAFAGAIGVLFEHLIREKGFTCVRFWTLTNEPNGDFCLQGNPFERFVEIHRLVREEFARRQLDVEIVGSDDAQCFNWFKRCVEDPAYYETADLFSSHRYIPFLERDIIPTFLGDRLALLRTHSPAKPLIVGEFGFHDTRSNVNENPIMKTYPYALWTTAFAIEALNRGVAGASIWALHEVYYPGGMRMYYALWDWKDENWQTRPVYHAWSMFTRFVRAGDAPRVCRSTHPDQVTGGFVNDRLFWVNLTSGKAEIHIEGVELAQVRVMTEDTLEGDRECGQVLEVAGNQFTVPPQSFGYATARGK